MRIDSIKNGYVIDHIAPGKSMEIYRLLNLGELDCPVAVLKNVQSRQMGKKDIIKIDGEIDLSLDALGFIDAGITVNTIKDGILVDKCHLELPARIENVARCKNPRCITSVEQELPHIFLLTDREQKIYRCLYCESKLKNH